MPMLVNKTYLVDTNDADEAYQLTKIENDKVGTYAVGQIRPYDPNAAQPGKSAPAQPRPPIAQPPQKS